MDIIMDMDTIIMVIMMDIMMDIGGVIMTDIMMDIGGVLIITQVVTIMTTVIMKIDRKEDKIVLIAQ